MNNSLNILCISRAYGEHAGGMERLSFELISALKKIETNEVVTLVYATKPGRALWLSRLFSVLFSISILPRAIMLSRNADIIHLGDPVLSYIGWSIGLIRRIPVTVTVHGLDVAYRNPLYQAYLRVFFRSFQGYIAISEHAQQLLGKIGISNHVRVIPPGVLDNLYDASKKKEDMEALIRKNCSGKYVFATIGRLVPRKGQAWFIEHIIPKLPETVVYLVAGDGPDKDRITRIIESLNLGDRVIMLGRISQDAQKILLNTVDAFIQPNIPIVGDSEGFGIAPLEAALCARPVFASLLEGIPSAIRQRKNGILLPAGETTAWINALTMFLHNPKSFEPSGLDARTYTLRTFHWDTVVLQYQEEFTRLASRS